jgi:3-oxoacyl-[acyl-carrier protein] reductase
MPLNPTPLIGKVAVILGGTGGIGLAISKLFAEAGARVAVVARQDRAKAAVAAAQLSGTGHAGYACRIEDSAQLTTLAESILGELGPASILVNAAGTTRNIPHADLDAMDDATFDQILSVNTRAAFAAVRGFVPQLREGGDGLVVNLSSISATTAVGSCIAYCVAKAGLDVMGAALARVLAPDIRVLTVSPGVVDTDFVPGRDRAAREKVAATTPLKRLCSAEDVAETVLACATRLRYSTGSVVQVDGGRHL